MARSLEMTRPLEMASTSRVLLGRLRDAAPALVVYAVVRAVGLLGVAVVAQANGQSMWARLHAWDALWLTRVAQDGYDTSVVITESGRPGLTDIVFFPLMPLAMRAVATVTGLSPYLAGLVVSALAGLAAAVAIDRIGRLVGSADRGTGRATGLFLVALWASWPHAIVLSMAYSEALFTALAAWCLLMLLRRQWLTAGVLCLLAGATRPTGVALAGALALAAAAEVVAAVRGGHGLRALRRPLAAVVLAPLGWLGFIAWVGHALGRWDGWFWMQRQAWLTHLDGGAYELDRLRSTLTTPGPMVFVICSLIVIAAIVALVALVVDLRVGLAPLAVYAALVLAVTFATAGYHHSKPRLLVVAFPLVIPFARVLAAAPRRSALAVAVTAALGSAWYGGYLLVVWTGSP